MQSTLNVDLSLVSYTSYPAVINTSKAHWLILRWYQKKERNSVWIGGLIHEWLIKQENDISVVVCSSLRHIDSLAIRVYKKKDDHPSGGPILGGLRRKNIQCFAWEAVEVDVGNPSEINILDYKLMRNILQRNHLIKQKRVILFHFCLPWIIFHCYVNQRCPQNLKFGKSLLLCSVKQINVLKCALHE